MSRYETEIFIRDCDEVFFEVNKFFKDEAKTEAWMQTSNLNFGGVCPLELIFRGKTHKVLQFIKAAREEGNTNDT